MDYTQEFKNAIAALGIVPPDHIKPDGNINRFSSNGKPHDRSGWYRYHDDDIPGGTFGCFRADISSKWFAKTKQEFTPEEKQAWQKRMKEAEAEREAQRLAAMKQAADDAVQMWGAGLDADHPSANHPYLSRKKIPLLGARVLRDMILIPVRQSAKEMVGLQRIWPDGTKRPVVGTPMQGSYTTIGKVKDSAKVVICEGWATGVSIHLATGYCVVVAFNAGNLKPVADKITALLPGKEVVVAADDDAWTTKQDGTPWNPGLEAAYSTGLPVYVPKWYGDREEGWTDFNDLHVSEGLGAVKECFEAPVPPIKAVTAVTAPEPVADSESDEGEVPEWVSEPVGLDTVIEQRDITKPVEPNIKPMGPVDYISPLTDATDKGKPIQTIQNIADICARLGVVVRYNIIKKEEEILIPGKSFTLDNRANATLAWMTSECAKFQMQVRSLGDFITFIADQNIYNPVAIWINSKPWDGVDRFSQFLQTVKAKDEDQLEEVRTMKETFITKWMISAVAAAFNPEGVPAAGVLVFQGDQYIGKTKWFKSLVPAHLRVLQDGVILRPDDKDSVRQCVSNWLVELGELDATFRKADIAALKSFLTKDRDVLRRAYAKKDSEYVRRTVFFASVNPREFLHDPTGNRRYWTIECEDIDHSHDLDMQQVWAQVKTMYDQGEGWYLSAAEVMALNDHNKQFEIVDPIAELILNKLGWDEPTARWSWQSATEVLRLLGRDTCTQAEATRAAHIIRERNGKLSRKSNGVRSLFVPPVSWD